MKSSLTRAQAVEASLKAIHATNATGLGGQDLWAEGFIAQLEAIGVTFVTPEQIERDALKFIHNMSGLWSRTNPGAVVEDMKAAGYTIVRSIK